MNPGGSGGEAAFRPTRGSGRVTALAERSQPLRCTAWLGGRVAFGFRRLVSDAIELEWTAPHHQIVLTDAGGTGRTVVRLDGERVYEGRDRPGVVSVVPAGITRHSVYEAVDLEYAAMWIAPAVLDELGLPPAVAPRINEDLRLVAGALGDLRREIEADRTPADAYISHLVAVLLHRLAGAPGALAAGRADAGRRLGVEALRVVQEYVEENLHASLSLWQLAATVGLSADTFSRRFKARTGMAPYAYVLSRRIAHARDLLRATERDVGEIGLALGFSSASHFASVFRQQTGVSPSAFRQHAR